MTEHEIQLKITGTVFKADLLQLISSVLEGAAKTIVAIKTGGVSVAVTPNLITGFFGALKSFKKDQTLELRAWLLVSGGLLYALEKAVKDTSLKDRPSPDSFTALANDIAIRVETRTYTIEPDFFSNPSKIGLIEDVAHELAAWIRQFGGTDKVETLRARLERYFPSGLHRTWMKDADRFESLEQALSSPFSILVKIQQEYDGYLQYIEEQFTQIKLIGQDEDDPSAVTLAQVFVPLRAYVEQYDEIQDQQGQIGLSEKSGQTRSRRKMQRRVVRLFESLSDWIASADRRDAIRIVSGGPGIGKSSSMRAFATSVARDHAAYPVLIPLQKLEKPNYPLRERIKDYLISTNGIPFQKTFPLDPDNRPALEAPIVLIFDGLDELVRPGRDADEITRDFMVDLRGLLEQENGERGTSAARILALITGRLGAAGSAARVLKRSGDQVLFLLRFSEFPHHDQDDSEHDSDFDDPEELLKEDQRKTWWKKWAGAAKGVPTKIPAIFLRDDLFDVTVEPLLPYFIAFVRPWEKGESDAIDRNWLYDRLLRDFHEREVSKGARNFAMEFRNFEDYEVVLQAMALAAWYDGSTRTGTIELVDKLLRNWDPGIAVAFKSIIGSQRPAVGVALAFYMKPGEQPNSYKFLHKTFAGIFGCTSIYW